MASIAASQAVSGTSLSAAPSRSVSARPTEYTSWVPVAAREFVQSWPTSDYGYYDVVVTADTTDGFTYRYAGRIS